MHTMLAAAALCAMAPLRALAAVWNRAAFESKDVAGAVQGLAIAEEIPSDAIDIVLPERAENGAVVQIEVSSRIPGTEAIAILVDNNPTPLIANFLFSNGALPYVVTRIKMADTSRVQAVVKAGPHYYQASRSVEVLLDGCN